MLLVLIELYLLRQLIHAAIDYHSDKSALLCLLQQLYMLSLSASDHRRKHHELIHPLVNRLSAYDLTTVRAVWYSHSGIEKSEIVVYLSDSANCGSGISVC